MKLTRIVSVATFYVVYIAWWWFSDRTPLAMLAGLGVALVAWFLSIGVVVAVEVAKLSRKAKG